MQGGTIWRNFEFVLSKLFPNLSQSEAVFPDFSISSEELTRNCLNFEQLDWLKSGTKHEPMEQVQKVQIYTFR